MKKMNIGMYYQAPTYLHKLDARVKVVAVVLITTLLFFVTTFWSYLLITSFLLGLILTAKLPLSLGSVKSLSTVLLLTLILSTFSTPGTVVLWELGSLYATTAGLYAGMILIVRTVLMLMTTTILTMTTTAFTLTRAIEFLLAPLKKLRFPVAEGALLVNLALRFIPTIISEKDRIIKAQKACGASFEVDGILKKAKSLIAVLIPLTISAFKRADDLALAMQARAFKLGALRTSYQTMKMNYQDYQALIALCLFFIMTLGLEIFINRKL